MPLLPYLAVLRRRQENPPTEFSPFCIQPYLVPDGGVRYVAVYMRSDHGTACEVFPVTYGSRYLDVASEATPAPAEVLPNVADATLLELRHVMLSMVTFMRKAHGETECEGHSLVCVYAQPWRLQANNASLVCAC